MMKTVKIFLRLFGIVLIGLGILLARHNMAENTEAAHASELVERQLEQLPSQKPISSENGEMPISTIDGTDYIGTIEIPSIALTLPVAADYNFEQMSLTPTRYTGSFYTNDLVICGHSYANHFRPLQTIGIGEEVFLKTRTGQTYRYVVTNRETIEPTAVDKVYKDTASDTDWDLSLFTCTPSGLARVLVRCSLVK